MFFIYNMDWTYMSRIDKHKRLSTREKDVQVQKHVGKGIESNDSGV